MPNSTHDRLVLVHVFFKRGGARGHRFNPNKLLISEQEWSGAFAKTAATFKLPGARYGNEWIV